MKKNQEIIAPDEKKQNDDRFDKVLEQISNLIKGDYKSQIPLNGRKDKITSICAGLNKLADNLENRKTDNDKVRLDKISEILLEYSVMNFRSKLEFSEKGDEIDSISAGLNVLGEELEFANAKQKKYATDLKKINSILLDKNDEILKKTEELKRSNSELEQFAYVASHDLQEPLRMIISYVQLIEKHYKDKLDKDANDFIHYAVDGANRMQTLIYSLLDYSRINRVKPFELIDLEDLLQEVMQDLSVTVKESKAKVSWGELPEIYGDKVLIGQLFFNLIANAIKFKDDRIPVIDISYKKENGYYVFAVKDNGIGIKKEYQEKIFVIFQRLHSKDKYPGTGIGLAICKKIVERHEGKIWVESELNKGSTFYFTIKADLGQK